jgi:hypothetical protein
LRWSYQLVSIFNFNGGMRWRQSRVEDVKSFASASSYFFPKLSRFTPHLWDCLRDKLNWKKKQLMDE